MTFEEYKELANRTCNGGLRRIDLTRHAVFGMSGEVGEISSFFQKEYQGHKIDDEELKLEVGDLLWFVAEMCLARDWNMDEIAQMNIDKLKKRYPEGFSAERSLHREE